MKTIRIITFLILGQLFSVQILLAQDTLAKARSYFYSAKQELLDMLDGKKPLSYEQAIFIIEDAYWENQADRSFFNYLLDFHTDNIQKLIEANRDYSNQDFKRTLLETEEQKKAKYESALTNWAIFTYMTDTTFFIGQNELFYIPPFTYSANDPLGTIDWINTQVFSLLSTDNKTGNCFAQVSLFKIFSERLSSEANICTAPGHIYLRHADDNGIYYNVELATRSFPGTGSLEVLTYTPDEATRNGISLRELNLKQSVALCLVYLAKGYEYKFHTKDDDFLLECAELALKYDSLNLNAMLLKAEVLEERQVRKNKTIAQLQTDKEFKEYENWFTYIHRLGYREMPLEMKNIIIARLRQDTVPYLVKDKTPQPNKHLGIKENRYATLSWGLFEEFDYDKPIEQYGRTLFDSKKKKITGFAAIQPLYNSYNFDPVVFAWQIDPLAHKYPSLSPYSAFANNPIFYVDPDGREPIDPRTGKPMSLNLYRAAVYDPNYIQRAKLKPVKDNDLYAHANPWIKRERGKPDGAWDGASQMKHDHVWMYTSSDASKALEGITGKKGGSDYGSPNDGMWRDAAEKGTYIFVDDRWAESEWLFIDLLEYNIMTVEENYITQVVNMSRPNNKSEYGISSVTTFDIGKGDIQSRKVSTWYGGTKTEKYRTLTVTETTQTYKDNKPSGSAKTETYTREEIIK